MARPPREGWRCVPASQASGLCRCAVDAEVVEPDAAGVIAAGACEKAGLERRAA